MEEKIKLAHKENEIKHKCPAYSTRNEMKSPLSIVWAMLQGSVPSCLQLTLLLSFGGS
jgi:hypothetical protein